MRKRFIWEGIAASLVIGIFFVASPSYDTPEPTPSPTADNIPATPAMSGTVMADDDDPAGLVAWQDSIEPAVADTPTYSSEEPVASVPEKTIVIDNQEYPLRTYRLLATPNDPYAGQWWESTATLTSAWDIPRGNNSTTLAIIDTGFALRHEEFTNRWYINPGESGVATNEQPSALNCGDRGLTLSASCNLIDDNFDNIVDNETGAATYQNPSRLNCTAQLKPLTKDCNRIDDDSNGYVDDVTGWDFINYDNSVQAGELNPTGTGTTHGTRVAGTAAATGNNGVGIAGADWGTKILPIQVLDDDSYGDTWSVGRGIYYAIAQDADVISISLGSDLPDAYVLGAVRAALAQGITVIAASGNDGCNCMVYPARYPEVLSVGALDTNSQRASFSSWGQNLDLLAPGTQLTLPTWSNASPTNTYSSGNNGTSFATPMVAGLMTRLLSHQPTATPQQLIAAIAENTNRLGLPSATLHDSLIGFGTLDSRKASLRMTTPVSPVQLYTYTPTQKGSYLTPGVDYEKNGGYQIHSCETGSSPATQIYELKKSSNHFFTISKVEQQQAVAQGYVSSIFTYGCLQQPHDAPDVIRALNIFREFRNISPPR